MNLLKNTSIYTITKLINQGIPFLLIPILTKYLTPGDYGILSVFNTLLAFLVIFTSLGIPSLIGTEFVKKNKEEFSLFMSNTLVMMITTTLIVIVSVYFVNTELSKYINFSYKWIILIGILAFFRVLLNIYLIIIRFKDKVTLYATLEIANTLLNIGLSLVFVILLSLQWEGRAYGIAISSILFGIASFYSLCLIYFKKDYISIFSMKSILKISMPIIPHNIAMWIRGGFDVILVTTILNSKEAGIYSIAFQLSSIVGILASAFMSAFTPYLYSKLYKGTNKDKKEIVVITYIYCILMLLIALFVSIFYSVFIPSIINVEYFATLDILYILVFSNAFLGMYYIVSTYIFYEKKTYELSKVTLSISILHVIVSYILTSALGIKGTAIAIFITYSISFIVVFKLSNKIYPMPWIIYKKHAKEKT